MHTYPHGFIAVAWPWFSVHKTNGRKTKRSRIWRFSTQYSGPGHPRFADQRLKEVHGSAENIRVDLIGLVRLSSRSDESHS
jgi:hypothetical protein